MEHPATTEAQKRTVVAWIASGFKSYAQRVDPDSEIRRYGEEFGRVLGGNMGDSEIDLPQLREDLLRLIDKQCPAVDVVELMVRCTSETNLALARGVQHCDVAEPDLSYLERRIRQAADAISQLRRSSVPGSLSPGSFLFIPDLFSGAVKAVEQARDHLKNLSEHIDSIAERLSRCRPADNFPYSTWTNAFLKDGDLGFFYRLLECFHCGYPTLSRLLKAMRRVRYIVDGDTESLRALSRKRIMASASAPGCESPECKVQDPFSQLALQRRMNRFFLLDVSMTDGLKKCVHLYYSDECISRQQGRETLMEFCDKIWERLVRGLKKRQISQRTTSSRTVPRAALFGPEATAGIPPTSSRRARTPNGALIHRVK